MYIMYYDVDVVSTSFQSQRSLLSFDVISTLGDVAVRTGVYRTLCSTLFFNFKLITFYCY